MTSTQLRLFFCVTLLVICVAPPTYVRAQTPQTNAAKSPQKKRTHLRLSRHSSAVAGSKITTTAELLDRDANVGISGKSITFTFDGKNVGSSRTGGDGKASLDFVVPIGTRTGSRSISATFAGDGDSLKDAVAGPLNVTKPSTTPSGDIPISGAPQKPVEQTILKVSDSVLYASTVVKYYGNVVFQATLTKGGKPIDGKTVTFEVGPPGSVYKISAVTDSNGVARVAVNNVTLTLPGGSGRVSASAEGASGSAPLTISRTD